MVSTQRIIVPLDGSALAEQAIPFAAALAGATGELTFLHVVPQPEPLRGMFGGQIASEDDVLSMATQTGTELMEETAGRWQKVLRSEPRIAVRTGDPAEATLKEIGSIGASMLALASHGRGLAGRVAFGSVADRLARSSPVPTLVIHPTEVEEVEPQPAAISRIVVPLDGSEIAGEALPVVDQIAGDTGLPILLVSAVNPSAVMAPSAVGSTYYPAELYNEIAEDLGTNAKQDLSNAESSLPGHEISTAVVEGPAVEAILSVLKPGDLIVMTSHGRSGFRRWLLGSVSEKLIRSGAAPIVLVPAEARTAASA